jgi:hypothetical protein
MRIISPVTRKLGLKTLFIANRTSKYKHSEMPCCMNFVIEGGHLYGVVVLLQMDLLSMTGCSGVNSSKIRKALPPRKVGVTRRGTS